jgi:hypothetical protein
LFTFCANGPIAEGGSFGAARHDPDVFRHVDQFSAVQISSALRRWRTDRYGTSTSAAHIT